MPANRIANLRCQASSTTQLSAIVTNALTTEDLGSAAKLGKLQEVVGRVPEDAWPEGVRYKGWTPLRTLDHLADTMLLYAGYVATRATGRITPPRNGDTGADSAALLVVLGTTTSILTRVLEGMEPRRGFSTHRVRPIGLDGSAWPAPSSSSTVTTSGRLAGLKLSGPAPLADRVVDRVFPWAPAGHDGWARLLWAAGPGGLSPSSRRHRLTGGGSQPRGRVGWRPRLRHVPPQW